MRLTIVALLVGLLGACGSSTSLHSQDFTVDAAVPDVSSHGGVGQPCYPNGTCDGELVCLSGVCVELPDAGPDAPAVGTEGGPCYGNGTCDPGLTCASDICVRLPDAAQPDSGIPDLQAEASLDANDDSAADFQSIDGDAPRDSTLDRYVWPDTHVGPDAYIWPDTQPMGDMWQWPDLYSGAPFGCQSDSDCFGQSCCPTPWGVKVCADVCG